MLDNRWVKGMALVTNTEPGDRESVDYIIKTSLHCLANDSSFLGMRQLQALIDSLQAALSRAMSGAIPLKTTSFLSFQISQRRRSRGFSTSFGDPWRWLSVPEL